MSADAAEMAPATEPAGTASIGGPAALPGFDLDQPWQLHEQVSIRPERFGALLYHFGTRRLSFLKSPMLLETVRELALAPSAREACLRAGVSDRDLPGYQTALATLAGSQMICERTNS